MPLNLVVQTAFLGDLLLSIPLLKKCREMWPEHQLGLVCRKGFGDFFLKTGLVHHVFEIEKGKADTYQKIAENLKSFEVDHLISPHESLRTAFLVSKIKARQKISFAKPWNFIFYNSRVEKDLKLPDPIRQISLLKNINPHVTKDIETFRTQEKPYLPDAHGKLSAPPVWASMSLRSQVLSLPGVYDSLKARFPLPGFDEGKAVLLFPGSVWATKRWTAEGFINAGIALQEKGYQVYVMGGPGEEVLAESVAKEIPGSICLAGKTKVIESTQLIARAALVIGNDSASTHLAAVCETPLIAVFGPTIIEFGFRPWSAESYIVHQAGLKCRPCGKHGHHHCPIGTHVCMKNISAEEVLKTAGFILR
ncbi:glycosyltransferase family 9 protein [Bdellovibrio reynosensis]|uniref:Glycosyltransferase family 9 protein n=1 Tax=Bdellovibrio reynosensis TaxID=2835041 RepID=A0ABY4CC99_9BACT|nr:glycosyltransferase family 9 protein [Bdellovibrio reynosensis]UOF02404.1 glycosyltransferase family 9 protein [Bdellovibrio reynosensis]